MSSLPVHLTSFIGRENEATELVDLVRRYRLVTVTGSGGSGKSRLAARVAAEVAPDLGDGAWWVDLAALTSGEMVADAVLAALGVADSPERAGLQRLSAFLTVRRVLIVLDNCEHVLDACTALVESVLRAAPGSRVLTTSREALGVPGEVAWQVPPLSLPAAEVDVPVETLGSYEAVQLFLDRAVLARPTFAVTNETAPVVAEICARLDGVPLAIELAAARVRVLSPRQILDGLADRFRLLNGGSRTGPERQRTLEASVAWSHDALTDRERALFRRLSVFHGGFTLAGAAAVGAVSGDCRHGEDVLEIVDSLVAKSLVVVDAGDENVRYRMLETLRQFAAARLDQAGETSLARDAHMTFCVGLAREAVTRLIGVTGPVLRDLLSDQDNMRQALDWALAGADTDSGLAIAYAHVWLLNLRGRYREACASAERALALPPPAGSSRLRGLVLSTVGIAQWSLGDLDAVLTTAATVRALAAQAGDEVLRAFGQSMDSWAEVFLDPVAAAATLEAGLPLAEACSDDWLLMNITCDHLILAMRADDLANGRTRFDRACAAAHAAGNDYFLAWSLPAQAFLALRAGDLNEARAAAERATALAEDLGDVTIVGFSAAALAWTHLMSGRGEAAGVVAADALRRTEAAGDVISRSALILTRALSTRPFHHDDCVEVIAAAVDAAHELGDPWQHAPAALTLARTLIARGDEAGAAAQIESARRSGHRLDSPWVAALADHTAGLLAAAGGEPARAVDFQHAALARALAHGYRLLALDCVEALADLALATAGDGPLEGVRLCAAASRARDELGYHFRWEDSKEATVAVQTRLGDDSYAAAWSAGAAMRLDDAAAYAARARGPRKRPTTGWASLTPTELEVARLAAAGLTNAAIGERLFIALGTVKIHLSRSYTKLGVANRTQLAAEATRRELP